jgi:hypothetical protein
MAVNTVYLNPFFSLIATRSSSNRAKRKRRKMHLIWTMISKGKLLSRTKISLTSSKRIILRKREMKICPKWMIRLTISFGMVKTIRMMMKIRMITKTNKMNKKRVKSQGKKMSLVSLYLYTIIEFIWFGAYAPCQLGQLTLTLQGKPNL